MAHHELTKAAQRAISGSASRSWTEGSRSWYRHQLEASMVCQVRAERGYPTIYTYFWAQNELGEYEQFFCHVCLGYDDMLWIVVKNQAESQGWGITITSHGTQVELEVLDLVERQKEITLADLPPNLLQAVTTVLSNIADAFKHQVGKKDTTHAQKTS